MHDEEFEDPNTLYGSDSGNSASNDTNSDGNSTPAPGLHRVFSYLVAAALVFALIFAVQFGGSWFSDSPTGAPPEIADVDGSASTESAKENSIVSDKIEEVTGIRIPEKPVVDWKAKEEIAVNKAAIVELQEKLDLLLQKSTASSEQFAELKSKLLDLRTSEAGFKLASDEASVIRFIGLEEKIGALTGEIPASNLFATEMKSLLSDVETRGDSSYAPDPFVVKRANEFISRHESNLSEIQRYESVLELLLRESEKFEAGVSLESAIRKRREADAAELAQFLEDARREAKEKSKAKYAEAVKKQTEAADALKLAEIAAATQKDQLAKDEKLAQVAKQKLEAEFNADLPKIRTYLAPFIGEGRNMRGNENGKGPGSYSVIVGKGALEESDKGLIVLGQIGTLSDRPKNGFPEVTGSGYMATHNGMDYLEVAQGLLKKYGPMMVEKGMLAE